MSREEAKKALIAFGIAEPTDEAITSYLNQLNSAVKSEKDRADKLKGDADKVLELQKQLDEINSKGLSDVEKANKAVETANKQVAELQKQIKTMQNKTKLAEMGITGDNADKFFTESGEIDFAILGQILSDTKANAAAAKEAEIAGKATNPGSGAASGADTSEGAKYAMQFNAQYTNTNGGN